MYSEKLKEKCAKSKWDLFLATEPMDLSLRNELFLKTNFLNGSVPYLLRVFCVNNDIYEDNSRDVINAKEYKEFCFPKENFVEKLVKSVMKRKPKRKLR